VTEARSWPSGISAITAFVEIGRYQAVYVEVFGLPVAYEDDASPY
jgi:hypothetical protein